MVDVKSTLTETLRAHTQADEYGYPVEECRCGASFTGDYAEHVANVLLGLSGVAVTQLPKPVPGWWNTYEEDGDLSDHLAFSDQGAEFFVTTWNDTPGVVQISHQGEPMEPISPEDARKLAADLLAAAVVSEGER